MNFNILDKTYLLKNVLLNICRSLGHIYIYIYTIDTQDEVICIENKNYAKIQNNIREIGKYTGYLIKKFK